MDFNIIVAIERIIENAEILMYMSIYNIHLLHHKNTNKAYLFDHIGLKVFTLWKCFFQIDIRNVTILIIIRPSRSTTSGAFEINNNLKIPPSTSHHLST